MNHPVSVLQRDREGTEAIYIDLGAWRTYLAIASLNRLLYSFGLVTVGRFLPLPANPRSLIHDSSLLSHV